MLRQAQPAGDAQIQQGKPAFERMHARFPAWLAIVAPRAGILHWQERSRNLTIVDDIAVRLMPSPPAPEKSRWLKPLLAVFVCLLALVIGLDMSAHRSPVIVQSPPHQAMGELSSNGPPAPGNVPPTWQRTHEIFSRIQYKPAKGEADIAREVSFDVFLDEGGKVFGANLLASSGSPRLDAAVKAAILGSQPFPQNTRKVFRFGVKYQPGVRSKRPR